MKAKVRPYLSVCAIFRDEAPYLREWIEFHRLVGVERFFLYDNQSSDNAGEILAPYVETGVVVLRPWPGHAAQLLCYLDATLRYRNGSEWIAFIDIDEFLFSPLLRPLPELLRQFHDYPAIGVNWCVFGTSDVVAREDALVTETFTRRTRDVGLNRHIKSIVNPRCVVPRRPPDPHHFGYQHRNPPVNELKHPIRGPFSEPVSFELLRINHYYSKSEEEAIAKAERARSDNGQLRPLESLLSPQLNEELDRTIEPYLPQLRSAVAGL